MITTVQLHIWLKRTLVLLSFLVLPGGLQAWAVTTGQDSGNKVVVGLFQGFDWQDNLAFLTDKYQPMTQYLSTQTGQKFLFLPFQTYASTLKAIDSHQQKFYWVPADLAVYAMQRGYKPVVRQEETFAVSFLVSANSAIKNMQDVKRARKIGFYPKNHVGTVLANKVLTDAKLSLGKGQINHANDPQGLMQGLKMGLYDVIAVKSEVAKKMAAEGGHRILAESMRVPGFTFVVENSFPEQQVQGMAQLMLHADPKTLNGLTQRMVPSDPSEYAALQAILK